MHIMVSMHTKGPFGVQEDKESASLSCDFI